MKNITIAGRLGKDPRLARTQDGDPILSFSVAVDDGYGDRKSTMWFDCSVFGKRATALEKHLSKGDAVTVGGDLRTREHEGKTYLQIRASEVTLQGGKSSSRSDDHSSSDQGSYGGGGPAGFDDGDEIPFTPEWRL